VFASQGQLGIMYTKIGKKCKYRPDMNRLEIQLKTSIIEESAAYSRQYLLTYAEPIPECNGHLFAIITISKHHPASESLGQIIKEALEISLQSTEPETNAAHQFEQLLESINQHLSQISSEWENILSPTDIHAMVGMVVDQEMYLSGTGNLCALFLHKLPDQRYQVFNLFRSIQTEHVAPNWQKLFAVVLDGDIHPGDIFCVSNEALEQEILPEDLHHILTTLPPQGAALKLRRYFSEETDFALFILKAQTIEESSGSLKPVGPQRTSAESSIRQLDTNQEKTARLLADQKPAIGNRIMDTWKKMKKGWDDKGGTIGIGRKTIRFLFLFIRRHINHQESSEHLPSTKNIIQKTHSWIRQHIRRVPKTSRYLALASIFFIIVLIISISAISQSRVQQAKQSAFNQTFRSWEEKRDQASGALIYGDETQARTLITETLAALEKTTVPSPEDQTNTDRLAADLRNMLDTLRHITHIPNPPVVGDLASISPTSDPQAMHLDGDHLVVFADRGDVYQLSISSKTWERILSPNSSGKKFSSIQISKENASTYLLRDHSEIATFDTGNNTSSKISLLLRSSSDKKTQWVDLSSYSGRLYILSLGTSGAEIIRFDQADGTFALPGTKWIRARTTDLSDATAMAVDGTVFVLKKNGGIVRFVSGSETGWKTESVDPPLTNASELWTDTKSPYLYVLEPSTKRLVVFNKEDGTFVAQYQSDALDDLVDVVVSENQKAIYFLADSKVYRVDASHLNKK